MERCPNCNDTKHVDSNKVRSKVRPLFIEFKPCEEALSEEVAKLQRDLEMKEKELAKKEEEIRALTEKHKEDRRKDKCVPMLHHLSAKLTTLLPEIGS